MSRSHDLHFHESKNVHQSATQLKHFVTGRSLRGSPRRLAPGVLKPSPSWPATRLRPAGKKFCRYN